MTATSNAIVQIALGGEIDLATVASTREMLTAALASAPGCTLEIDMSAVTFLDSTGIGVLVGVYRRATEAGGTIRLTKPNSRVARVLALTRLDTVLGAGVDEEPEPVDD